MFQVQLVNVSPSQFKQEIVKKGIKIGSSIISKTIKFTKYKT